MTFGIGIYFLMLGFCYLLKMDLFIHEKIKVILGEGKYVSYKKGLVFPCMYLGALMICMGIVERMETLSTIMFFLVWFNLGIIPIILLIENNKQHTGQYWFRINDFK